MDWLEWFTNNKDIIANAIAFAATIAASISCWFSYKSAKAAKEQVLESKRQFEETRRLEMMPYLQFGKFDTLSDCTLPLALADGNLNECSCAVKLQIKNIGNGTATEIKCTWTNYSGSYALKNFPVLALRSGEFQNIKIDFASPQNLPSKIDANFKIDFVDLLDNRYTQKVSFCFSLMGNQLALQRFSTHSPQLLDKA